MDYEPLPFRERVGRSFQYLYFLRVSILAWLLLPVLLLVDHFTGAAALTRGILTVDSGWQATYAAFFIVTLNMTVLVTARNAVLNGTDRFRMPPPPWLEARMAEKAKWDVVGLLLFVHLPSFASLYYLGHTAAYVESEQFDLFGTKTPGHIWFFLAAGSLAALLFWYLVSLFYYWSYTPSDLRPRPSTLIFPRSLFGNTACAARPRITEWLHWTTCNGLRVSCPGYAGAHTGPVWELHYLSTLALLGFLLLYIFLCPLTAPVSFPQFDKVCIVLAFVLLGTFLLGLTPAPRNGNGGEESGGAVGEKICPINPGLTARQLRILELKLRAFFGSFAVAVAAMLIGLLLHDIHSDAPRYEFAFPTLASVIVLVTFGLWFMAGASFFFDRYRIPLLTTVIALIFLPKYVHLPWTPQVDLEHYFAVRELPEAVVAPTPKQVVDTFREHDLSEPYVIVTAAGGGIQAAEWTSQVMAELEKRFANDATLNPPDKSTSYTLHDHLLLASGVSGGSVGLMPYLLEYTAAGPGFPNQDDLRARLTNPPACSSLEAVAWGLTYYDVFRALFTFSFWPASDQSAAPDRTWALTKSFNRNLTDHNCHKNPEGKDKAPSLPTIQDGEKLTLAGSVDLLKRKRMPAFTFNATAAETGGRFLLSNYQVPQATSARSDSLPAESFLQAYAQDNPCGKLPHYADLSLATAARLSATFPYVSSGTRIPTKYADHAFHFLDGGYYDNDGTASVIEFLMAALAVPGGTMDKALPCPDKKRTGPAPTEVPVAVVPGPETRQKDLPRLKILLIEIRNGADLNALTNEDGYVQQAGYGAAKVPTPWKSGSQILGPAEALWNAGHVSVTRRNRLGLCLLETAYQKRLEVHHLVFTIDPDGKKTSPLSWHLTAQQRLYIDQWATYDPAKTDKASRALGSIESLKNDPTQRTISEAVNWVKAVKSRVPSDHGEPANTEDICRTSGS